MGGGFGECCTGRGPAVTVRTSTVGLRLPCSLRRVLAGTRQCFLGRHVAALVCQPLLGASLRKGWFRMIGTLVGGIAIVALTACFPQNRTGFLVSLALWGAACALVATLLHNFTSYAAALAGYTAAIIASDQLGSVGGLNGQAFMLAVTRASEICIGIVCAGVVLAATDLGGAQRRLAGLFAAISAEISGRFTGTLA